MRRTPSNVAIMAVGIVLIAAGCTASDVDDAAVTSDATPSVSEAPLDGSAPIATNAPPSGGDNSAPTSDSPIAGSAQAEQTGGPDKVTICHRTNGKNEWVEITISESAINAHLNHPWGSDIIPAPPTGCPSEPTPTTAPPEPTTTPPQIVPPTTAPPEPTTTPPNGVTPTTAPPLEPTTTPPDALLPATSEPSASTRPPTQPPGGTDPDELPPTGGNWMLSLLALALVSLGAGAIRVSRR